MTDESVPEGRHHAEPKPSKGKGCFIGGLVTIGALIAATVIGGIFATVIGPAALASTIVAIGLLIGAAFYWKEMPGFLLGMGLTIAISIAIGSACTALLLVVPA